MSQSSLKLLVIATAWFCAAAITARAQIVTLPTYQEWQFSTSANPAYPEVASNPYGLPFATVTVGEYGSGWLSGIDGDLGTRRGYWDLGSSGRMALSLPSAAASEVEITLGIVQFYSSGFFTGVLAYDISGASLVSSTRIDIEPTTFGKWVRDTTVWRLTPSPDTLAINITGPAFGSVIDGISVSVVPEPSPFWMAALLAMGAVALRGWRFRRKG